MLGVVDAAWLYLLLGLLGLLGLFGFVAGVGHSPLSWLVAPIVLVMGVFSRALYELMPADWRFRGALMPLLFLLVAWLSVGSASDFHAATLGPVGPLELLSGVVEFATLMAIAFALLIVAGLWQHGGCRAWAAVYTVVIARSFRTGLVVFLVLLAFEAAGDLNLGTHIAMGPFFVASLLCMALAHAPVHGVALRVWFGLISAAIAAIVASGLALALLAVALVRGGFGALREVWLDLAHAVDRSVSETLTELLGTRDGGGLGGQSAAWEPSQTLMLLVVVLGAAVFSSLRYRLVNAPPPLKLPDLVLDFGRVEHEEIADSDNDSAAHLFEELLPRWPWRRRADPVARPLPGNPRLARIYRLYYQLLERALEHGVELNPARTPRERQASLRGVFPQLPVDRLTEVFEAACYGHEAAPQSELNRLSAQLNCAT